MQQNPIMPAPLRHRETGSGPAVLLVHGWMVSSHVWDALLPLLPDYRLILPDLNGSGGTTAGGSAMTLDGCVADLLAFCEELDLQGVHLVGHSMGAQLATLLAARAPRRFSTLTLVTPVPVSGLSLPDEVQSLFRNSGGDRNRLGAILDMACLKLPAEKREAMLDDAMRIAPAVISTGFEAWRRGRPETMLEPVSMPTTVIATDDPFLPPAFLEQAVVAQLPNAQLVHLPGPGHYPQVESPRETTELLRSLFA